MEGWISLYRKVLDNPIVCKDSDYFSVWVYLLLNATHKEYPALFKGKKIMLQPGQLITGRKSIAEIFKIDESKVKRILIDLENDQQIDRQRSNKNSLISIVNWSKYQNIDQQSTQQIPNRCPTNDQQMTTNNNVITKQHNNDNNQLTNKEVGELAKHYSDCFRKMIPPIHLDKLKSYLDDGLELELIKYIMEYSSDKKEPWKYCSRVLENSVRDMITTVDEFKSSLKTKEGAETSGSSTKEFNYAEVRANWGRL